MGALEDLSQRLDNRTLRDLPLEVSDSNVPRQVRGACFSTVPVQPLETPRVVAVSPDALALLDLDADEAERPEFVDVFAGNAQLPGTQPAAHCYCGFQFGYFSGQLGDGAAMYLGEVVNSAGERWELQLKGAGLTPYSRQADGRKVLRSSIREFLASEAMHALGIPTTRAASVLTSDTRIERDPFYDGRVVKERASVVSRLAPTFLRFGSFEIFRTTDAVTGRAGPSAGLEPELLPRMVDFTVRVYFPDVWAQHVRGAGGVADEQRPEMVAAWFGEVARRTGRLVALWQCCGFVHGVLNTDNMSITGHTLDYGPYGWPDRCDPDFVPNGSDDAGRYDYKSQPAICRWNCERLAEALAPLLPPGRARRELLAYDQEFDSTYWRTMRRKLGLLQAPATPEEEASDRQLVDDLLALMADTGADFTNTFRHLARFPTPQQAAAAAAAKAAADGAANGGAGLNTAGEAAMNIEASPSPAGGGASSSAPDPGGLTYPDGGFLSAQLDELASPAALAEALQPRTPEENLAMLGMLAARDPALLHALGASQAMISRELERAKQSAVWRATSAADKRTCDASRWGAWLQRYGARLAREVSADSGAERGRVMREANPRYVLRNWIAERAIKAAEGGDYSEVRHVLKLLRRPFSDDAQQAEAADTAADGAEVAQQEGACRLKLTPVHYDGPPPAWASKLCVTCSS